MSTKISARVGGVRAALPAFRRRLRSCSRALSGKSALLRVLLTAATIIAGAVPAVAAEETPKIAVYVTGGKSESENRVLMTLILDALIKSGRYEAIERTDDFVAQIDREQAKQRSGAVDDNQIRQVGIQAGVQFVCVTNMECAFGSCLISARIIDVETAKVTAMATAESRLGSMEEIRSISNEIVANMLNYRTTAAPAQPEKKADAAAPARAPVARVSAPVSRGSAVSGRNVPKARRSSMGLRYGMGDANELEVSAAQVSGNARIGGGGGYYWHGLDCGGDTVGSYHAILAMFVSYSGVAEIGDLSIYIGPGAAIIPMHLKIYEFTGKYGNSTVKAARVASGMGIGGGGTAGLELGMGKLVLGADVRAIYYIDFYEVYAESNGYQTTTNSEPVFFGGGAFKLTIGLSAKYRF